MPPKTSKPKQTQPKIKNYTKALRSKHNSAPGSTMDSIVEEEEDNEEIEYEEPLNDEVSLKEVIHKLNDISKRVEDIEHLLFDEAGSIQRKLASQEHKVETSSGKLLFMSKEYKAVKQDLAVVKGVLQKQSRQIDNMDNKIVDLTARSMSMNLIMSGLLESRSESCKLVAKDFLKAEMDIDLDTNPECKIKVAHRIGVFKTGTTKPRAMVVKVNSTLKQEIMSNLDRLDGRANANGDSFYINVQQPEARVEAKRNARALLRKYQSKYSTAKVEIKADKVYVNNEWKKPLVHAPTPQDLFFEQDEQKEMNKMKIIYTQPEDHSYSNFWSAAVRVTLVTDVQRACNKIRQEAPSIDHIAVGYVTQHEDEQYSGLVDDREYGSSHKILKAIREESEEGIAVFVARKFGGVHMGPNRFTLISRLATKAIHHMRQVLQPDTPERNTRSKSPSTQETAVKEKS